MSGEALSARQLSVASMVAGLSSAAVAAARGNWLWMLLWTAAGVGIRWIVLRRMGNAPLFQGSRGAVLAVLYRVWAVVLAGRVLSRAGERLELTSGGSPKFWLVVLVLIPLMWICWGKAAPFFRMAEILWLAMAVVLVLVIGAGLINTEWRYVQPQTEDWFSSALAIGEVLAPSLFVLPYIYNVEKREDGKGLIWLGGLGLISALLSLVVTGILGQAVVLAPLSFFVAAGTLGKTARCEGLLSVLWLIPDLILSGLLCRVWGARRWPAVAALLAAALAVSGLSGKITEDIYAGGTVVLLLAVLLLPERKGKIVAEI